MRSIAASATGLPLRLAIHRGGLVPDIDTQSESASLLNIADYIAAAETELAVVAGDVETLTQAERDNPWATATLTRARGRLEGDQALLKEAADMWHSLGARFERASTLILTAEPEEGYAELRALGIVTAEA